MDDYKPVAGKRFTLTHHGRSDVPHAAPVDEDIASRDPFTDVHHAFAELNDRPVLDDCDLIGGYADLPGE